jgi:hypothetical protein
MTLLGKSRFFLLPVCFLSLAIAVLADDKPDLRLPESVAPTSYRAELTLDPATDVFSGQISINIDVNQPLKTIWLNATDISVSDASLSIAGQTLAANAATSVVSNKWLDI